MMAIFSPCDFGGESLHFMGQWGEPDWLDIDENNRVLMQKRNCGRCNKVEYRRVKILE